jgi:hypothetical protein
VLEQPAQLLGREEVEKHQDVGLLGDLVAIGRVVLGFQHPVEPLDAVVSLPVSLRIELLQLLVAFELAYDAIPVKRDLELAGNLVPVRQLVLVDAELPLELKVPLLRQDLEHLERMPESPGGHDVGIRVVVERALLPVR